MPTIARIDVTPVKGFALLQPSEVLVDEHGVVENRRFFLVDERGERLRSSVTAWPVLVHGRYDPSREVLAMRFPDGTEVDGSALADGETLRCDFPGRVVDARVVAGPWTEKLSELAGRPIRLVRPERHGATFAEPVTLMSEASLERLGRQAGAEVDGRRFRMLFTLAGCGAHEEDEWRGRLLRAGEALLRVGGPVDRCAATTRNPETGVRDLDTLRLLKDYRGIHDKAVYFGVLARVETPGRVRIGDAVELL